MPDATPAAQPQPKKSRATPGVTNRRQEEALDRAGLVIAAARKADYATALAGRDINAEFVNQLDADLAACKARIGKAVDLTNDIRAATQAESQAQSDLVAAIKEIQTAAKQKYGRAGRQQVKDYLVGERLDASRAALVQMADSIAEKLKSDTLPGITAAKVEGLKSLRDAYVAANAAQADAQSKATAERDAIEAAVQNIADRRVQIQFAAEAQWPSDAKANAPIRREFQIPTDRPFSG